MRSPLIRVAMSAVLLAIAPMPLAAQGPVSAFVAEADSVALNGGDRALAQYVRARPSLVGAVVAHLLDVAFQEAQQGNADGERENLAFARRVARMHGESGGSVVTQRLVDTYTSWTGAQRATRSRAIELEQQAQAARDARELEKAERLYDEARSLFEAIGDTHSIAVNWGSLGVTHWYAGDMDRVIDAYTRALEARRAVEDRILEGRTLNGLGSTHQQKGEYEASERFYLDAIDVRRQTGDLGGLGSSLNYLGNTYYLSGRLIDARDKWEEALPILERLGDPGKMVDILNSVATLYAETGRIAAANDTYLRAIAIAESGGMPDKEMPCRLNLADSYRQLGRYREAFEQYARVESLVGDDQTRRAELFRGRGIARMAAGDRDGARDDLLAASQAAQNVDDPGFAIEVRINIGVLYRSLEAYDRALAALEQAKQMAIDAGHARHYRTAMSELGVVHRLLGHNDEAMASFEEALAQDELDGMVTLASYDRVNIAVQKTMMGMPAEARADFHATLVATQSDYVRWLVHLGLGETFEVDQPDSAAYYYDRALALMEETRASLGAVEVESGFLSGERRFFYEQIAHYYASRSGRGDDKWSARAFHTMERARTRKLLDRMALALSSSTTPEEERLLDAIENLDDDSRRSKLREELESARADRTRASFGDLASPVMTLGDIQSNLPKGTVALSYALGDTASLLWAMDRDAVALFQLPDRRALAANVDRLRDALRQPGAGDADLRAASRALYDQLVAPAGDLLNDAKQVLILPDGFLFEVPFEALLTSDVQSDDWRRMPWFGSEFTTSYAPSASVYVEMNVRGNKRRGEKRSHELDLVAYGAPDYGTLGQAGAALAPLPFAGEEVEAIGLCVKEKRRDIRVGAGATELAFREQMRGAAPRVFHLATHGIVDDVEPQASSVVLASDPDARADGFLRASEIMAARCDAGLVVLSACESARGRVTRGEGVLGLSRAFIASGAGGVVASLWAVSDESTSSLMLHFYKRMMGKKKSAAEAMRYAREEMLKSPQYSHPFYWSPFIVMSRENAPW